MPYINKVNKGKSSNELFCGLQNQLSVFLVVVLELLEWILNYKAFITKVISVLVA